MDDSTPAPWPPMIGSQYALGKGATKVGCYSSTAVLDKIGHDIDKHDDEGFQQDSEGAVIVESGTKVRVLGYNLLNGDLDVRIRGGEYAGRECWYMVGNENDSGNGAFFQNAIPDQ